MYFNMSILQSTWFTLYVPAYVK